MFHIAWSPVYAHPLPEGHRFPMEKYDLLPRQLLHEGTIGPENIFQPDVLADDVILLTHDDGYLQRLNSQALSASEIRRTGFPLSPELVIREKTIMNGTLMAARYALEFGVSMNIAGGTHHAFRDRGEGFCLLNDIAIAANYLLHAGHIQRALVIDLDVHQGNGTAAIFRDDPRVFTFSIHGEKNYPFHKERSDRDIELADGTGDHVYLKVLREHLEELVPVVRPDILFYQSGVDVISTDQLGKLALTLEGCRQRDKLVLETAYRQAIPVCASMGGGYSQKISHIIEAHANTFRLASHIFS